MKLNLVVLAAVIIFLSVSPGLVPVNASAEEKGIALNFNTQEQKILNEYVSFCESVKMNYEKHFPKLKELSYSVFGACVDTAAEGLVLQRIIQNQEEKAK